MTHSRRQLVELLDRHGISLSRALGQNYVADPNTVRRIAHLAGVGPGDHVVEIGAGVGSLTLALAETGAHVTAIELDRFVVPVLRDVIAGATGADVTVVEADATEVDWSVLLSAAPRWSLVANLPYNIATTLVLDLLAAAPAVERLLVMVQREVGERLAAPPGTRACGIPSVKRAWWADAVVVGRVPATVFVPAPRVESALLQLRRHELPGDDALRAVTFALVDTAFGQRRKMLRRSLVDRVPVAVFADAGVDPELRPEDLTLDDWLRLAGRLGDRGTA